MDFDILTIGIGELVCIFIAFCYVIFTYLPFYIALITLLVVIAAYLGYLQYRYSYWQRRGISGPPANFLFGHTMMIGRGLHVIDTEWTNKYGSMVGTYILGAPDLIVTDLDILRHVLVKDFPNFINRRRRPGLDKDSEKNLIAHVLTVMEDQHWKNVRSTVTPAFTTGKMKNMIAIFNDCMKILGEVMGKYADNMDNNSFDAKKICGGLTMDVIAKSAFAIDIDAQRDHNSPFIKYANQFFDFRMSDKRLLFMGIEHFCSSNHLFAVLFPNVTQKISAWFDYQIFGNDALHFFTKTVTDVLHDRKKNPRNEKPDFLQLLLNVINESDNNVSSSVGGKSTEIDKEITHANIVKEGNRVKLSEIEIVAQSFLFLIAGYETSANTLHFALFLIALHPDIQHKCFEEVCNVIGDSDDITYEHLSKLIFIEQVIAETLRLYPPAMRLDRQCNKDIEINNVLIEKDTIISVPVWVIHHDERYYPEPEKFDPDRFSSEEKSTRDPLTYMPFGHGPRNCIGMRFAQLEIRMAFAYLIKHFEFLPCEQTPTMPIKIGTSGFSKPAEPIYLSVKRR